MYNREKSGREKRPAVLKGKNNFGEGWSMMLLETVVCGD